MDSFLIDEELKDIKIDLHMHSTASDGTWTPEVLVEKVCEAGIKVFALTDHDSTDNVSETAELARAKGIKFIPGVEVNTTYKNRNYHILGLGIDPEAEVLSRLIKRNKELMEEVDYKSIKLLEEKYPHVSIEEYTRYERPLERGGWKALSYTIDKGLCASYKDFFSIFGENYNAFFAIEFASPKEAAAAIISAGGVPILAHPGAGFYEKDYKSIIASMITQGIMGIECFHPDNSEEITAYCLDICKENKLIITGGSDCHGEFVVNRRLGRPNVTLSKLKLDDLILRY